MRTLFAAIMVFAAFGSIPAVAQSAPPNDETVCYEVYKPVCGTKEGGRKTYANECFAKRDGAIDIAPGQCSPGKL